MPVPRSAAFVVVAALLVAAGCVQTTPPGPLPQATPSWSCTPVAGGTPYRCYEHDYQEAAAQNKLYEQAEAVYRKYHAEYERIYRAGGVSEPTPVLLETTTGQALDSAMANFRDLLSGPTRLVSGTFTTAWIRRLPSIAQDGSVATLEVCSDSSEAVIQTKGQKAHSVGQDTDERYYLIKSGSELKLGLVEHKWVEAC